MGARRHVQPANGASPAVPLPTLPIADVIGVGITALGFRDQVALICRWAERRDRSRVVCVANVHMMVEARRSPEFLGILEQADIVTPDGMPLVWVMRFSGARRQQRVAGMDLLPALCGAAERRQVGIYFLGATSDVLARIRERLNHERPNVKIVGMEALPFRPMTDEEDSALVARVNASGAGLILVALGCPKQEIWMDQHRDRLQGVMVGLGAAFPVYAGVLRRAPRVMRRTGTEWLFRLITEPRRLWKRYLVTNTLFCYYVTIGLLRRPIGLAPRARKEPRGEVSD